MCKLKGFSGESAEKPVLVLIDPRTHTHCWLLYLRSPKWLDYVVVVFHCQEQHTIVLVSVRQRPYAPMRD